ncbi:MAG: hypothetical protein BGO67_10955 [Alphaproteobacteria bacterium 41-28]|nr:MAG: hypothetical protein BGO67_10955 [Alphaproteobacteria bacterium 41-28]
MFILEIIFYADKKMAWKKFPSHFHFLHLNTFVFGFSSIKKIRKKFQFLVAHIRSRVLVVHNNKDKDKELQVVHKPVVHKQAVQHIQAVHNSREPRVQAGNNRLQRKSYAYGAYGGDGVELRQVEPFRIK